MIPTPPDLLTELTDLYQDLHRHPELSFAEHRTAALVAARLRALGCDTFEGVGGTGVVGVLERGEGPTVLLRADMDALPVTEKTGLPYASAHDGVAHACGHDLHTTWLIGAATLMARHHTDWAGRLLLVFQPAEETGRGARAMLDDGLYKRFGTPAVAFGQHVGPGPAGQIGHRHGVAMAAGDAIRIRLHGKGGHGSRPEATVDPVVMAAATVLRLQTVVSREMAASDPVVLTVGSLHAGTKENIIPDEAELGLSLRSLDPAVRERALAAIERIVRGEAAASGAPEPDIDLLYGFPALVNDARTVDAVLAAFAAHFAPERLVPAPVIPASEDFGLLTDGGRIPSAYWFVRGTDPAAYARAQAAGRVAESVPTNHSPYFAPVLDPTLATGVETLVGAALAWLGGR
ncbi:amidohydrolase [Streptomyces sp. NPDC059002]|uniref:amidohydrolase n=1 Tax=Streptomyces sp. NPDC059002 TaxID=3346690 RepID=UPI003691AD78